MVMDIDVDIVTLNYLTLMFVLQLFFLLSLCLPLYDVNKYFMFTFTILYDINIFEDFVRLD